MNRILIVRLSAIGDVIHGLPVLCALRDAFPAAHLGWVVEGRAGDLLEGHPALNSLIRVPRRWLVSPREVLSLRNRLRALRFDTAIDLQCLTKSAVAAMLSGARRRIGKAGADGRELSKLFHNELVTTSGDHVIEHYLRLLVPLGIAAPLVRFELPQREPDLDYVERFLRSRSILPAQFVLLNPGAGWPSKLWPAEHYGRLAAKISRQHDLPSIVAWAGNVEWTQAQTVVACSRGAASLAPPTTITQLAELARRARLFVGSDTGPMHLAVAVGTPTISMHGPSRAQWCGAYGSQNVRLQTAYDDGTSRHRRAADNWAMRQITVDLVNEASDRLLTSVALPQCG